MVKKYIPKKGDLIYLTFDPQSGHEQKGRRPAIVISNDIFNKKTGFIFVAPITNTNRNSKLHIELPKNDKLAGFILTEQIKSVDYNARKAQFISKAPSDIMEEVLAILDAIIY